MRFDWLSLAVLCLSASSLIQCRINRSISARLQDLEGKK